MSEIENMIAMIDSRVKRLEKANDEWMSTHGEMNQGIYDTIQKLMDERDYLLSIA